MVDVTNLADAADKLERRGSQSGQDYASGVSSVSSSEQQNATLNAVDSWEQGIQNAIANNSFESGVSNPNKDWQTAALETGQNRFTSGMQNAGPAWQTGFAPVADTLEALTLEPRGPRGSSANRNRMNQVFDTLSEFNE